MLEGGVNKSSHISCKFAQQPYFNRKLATWAFRARTAPDGCRNDSRRAVRTPAPRFFVSRTALSDVQATSCCSLAACTALPPKSKCVHLLGSSVPPRPSLLCRSSHNKQQKHSPPLYALSDGPVGGSASTSGSKGMASMPLQQQQQQSGTQESAWVQQQAGNTNAPGGMAATASSGKCCKQHTGNQQGKDSKHSPKPQQQRLQQQRQRTQLEQGETEQIAQQQRQQEEDHRELQQQPQAQQVPAALQSFGQYRQQLKHLLQQQQAQLQEAPTSSAGLRAAAGGSTALLLSLLNSQMPRLVGSSNSRTVSSSSSSSSDTGGGWTPSQQRALLREAVVCISWHCSTHRLLPAEAQQLQELLLGRLLPALAAHVNTTNRRVLARVVLALGSCWASGWQQQHLDSSGSTRTQQQQGQDENEVEGEYEADRAEQLQQLDSSRSTEQQQSIGRQPAQEQGQQAAATEPGKRVGQPMVSPDDGLQQQQLQQQQLEHVAAMQLLPPGSSAAWVQHLLQRLPPLQLSAGALLATLEGCGLHEVKPPTPWLDKASLAVYNMLEASKLDFNDAAALLQALAQLEYSPPAWMMHTLVWRLQQWIPLLNPADLAGVLSALQVLEFRPGNTWLRIWCESSSRLLRGMTIGQLAAAAGALAWAGYSPKPWWGARLFDASGPLLPVATADELLLLLDAVVAFRLSPPLGWLHTVYCSLRAVKRSLSLSQVADAAHVLGSLQLPVSLYRHHRLWLAGCLKASQVQDVAGLGRAELLYLLYAAGKLRLNPRRAWLAAALQRLHVQLEGASPAELVGSFVVFCVYRSHLPLQRAQGAADMWLRDCLAAVVECAVQFSDEGLLQLLLACVDADLGAQQQQQQDATEVVHELMTYVQLLTDTLIQRLPRMSLLQLSRVCKALEGKLISSNSKSVWFASLLQKCKSALAAMA